MQQKLYATLPTSFTNEEYTGSFYYKPFYFLLLI